MIERHDTISEIAVPPGTAENRSRLYEDLVKHAGDDLAYELVRPDGDDDPATTFSTDAMEGLNDAVMAFVGSRIMKHWQATGKGPKKARIIVKMQIE